MPNIVLCNIYHYIYIIVYILPPLKSVNKKRKHSGTLTQVEEVFCHRNLGPGNFGPGDQNFQWKIGPAGPIFSGKMVRLWKIGPNNGPSISALVTSDCCG